MKDKLGILTSAICIIHCIVFPLFFTMIPFLELLDERFEWLLLVAALFIGILSFYDNYKKHSYSTSIKIFSLAFVFIGLAKLSENEFYNIIGLILLIAAHITNYQFVKKKDGCHPHNCKH
jgi:uncharacterized membrane protein